MLIDLDKFQILYYLEGCARGSHLRQGCWHDMIKLYPKMDQPTRDFLYKYAQRDIAPLFAGVDGLKPMGAEEFGQFLACFKPDNRYLVTAGEGDKAETAEAYFYNGRYYIDDVRCFDDDKITEVRKL